MKIKNKPYSKAQSPEKSVSTTSKTIKYNNYAVNVGSEMFHYFLQQKKGWSTCRAGAGAGAGAS